MNEIIDPLLRGQASNEWAPPTPPAKEVDATRAPSSSKVDRRQMLEELKARQASASSASTANATASDVPETSRTTKKKSARPARAAKILVFGLSTTAMFGAVTGYALADLHKQQHQKSIPIQPAVGQVTNPVAETPAPAYAPQTNGGTTQTPAAQASEKKAPATQTPATQAPVVDTPVAQAPVADQPASAVVDVPVPSAAQPGQGQSSGGNQQSSGSY